MVAYALWSLHLVQTEDQEFKASLEERREEGLGRLDSVFLIHTAAYQYFSRPGCAPSFSSQCLHTNPRITWNISGTSQVHQVRNRELSGVK